MCGGQQETLSSQALRINLLEIQLFLPTAFWKITSLRDAVEATPYCDCLGRSIMAMRFDAGLSLTIWNPYDSWEWRCPVDLLGRTPWYLVLPSG